jgi:hypothetical protein
VFPDHGEEVRRMQIPSRKRLVTGIALALVTAALSSPTTAQAAQACPIDPDANCLVASAKARQAQGSQPASKVKKPKRSFPRGPDERGQ